MPPDADVAGASTPFSLTRANELVGLSLRHERAPLDLGCVQVATLELDAGDAPALDATKTRRLTLRRATLSTSAARLQDALLRLNLSGSGFRDLNVRFEADGPWLSGRFLVDEKEAPFTVRLALEPRADTRRRLRVFLGDVRLYAPLTIPAPAVGALLATAIVTAWAEGGAALRASGAALDLAPLDLALPYAMVAAGWRLPNLGTAALESIEQSEGELRLIFGGERRSTERVTPLDAAPVEIATTNPSAWIEGERLPDALAAADEKLYAGDRAGAEADYRRLLTDDETHGARAVRARLAALRLAAGAPDTGPRGVDMTRRWPAFVPGWLTAALAAVQNDEHAAAAAAFAEVAALAMARGESEDARLAMAAAEAVRTSAPLPVETPEALAETLDSAGAAEARTAPPPALEDEAPTTEAPSPSGGDDAAPRPTLPPPFATPLSGPLPAPIPPSPPAPAVSASGQETADAAEEDVPFAAVTVTQLTHGRAPLPPPGEASAIPRPADRNESGNITSQTRAVYAAESDPETRDSALGDLLKGFDSLPPDRQRAAYASFARVAESTGDLAHAEEAYWRGTTVSGRPEQAVDLLLAHARLLLSRGSDRAALVDLEEALKLAPANPHAVAARAELAFRDGDFTRARELYDQLEGLGSAAEAVARETLLHRRAVLARAAGDDDAAESCFRELAMLDPRQVEAREALADLAFQRGDLETAAQYLEEALRLLPLDALDALLELRTKLGDVHIGLGDWEAARRDLELLLDQDPSSTSALEHLADVYERMERFDDAARACDQLSRLYRQSRKRAEALYRRGELLAARLGDEARAFDSFLKSSDLDPTFVPTALRLVTGFFQRGAFEDVAELAEELEKAQELTTLPLPVRLRLAMSLAVVRGGAMHGLMVVDRSDLGDDTTSAVATLKEAAPHLLKRRGDAVDPVMALFGAFGAEEEAAALLGQAATPAP